MKKGIAVFFFLVLISGLSSADLENFDNNSLIEQYGMFDGYYYQTTSGTEKLRYSIYLGPSQELKSRLFESEKAKIIIPRVNDKLVLGNLVFWGSLALLPADVVFLANYGNSMSLSNALSIYFGVACVSVVGELIGGSILYDAKNLTAQSVWEYNRFLIAKE